MHKENDLFQPHLQHHCQQRFVIYQLCFTLQSKGPDKATDLNLYQTDPHICMWTDDILPAIQLEVTYTL